MNPAGSGLLCADGGGFLPPARARSIAQRLAARSGGLGLLGRGFCLAAGFPLAAEESDLAFGTSGLRVKKNARSRARD